MSSLAAASRARRHRLVVLPGDGIGPEVMRAGLDVLDAVARRAGFAVDLVEFPAGAAAIEACGEPLPDEALDAARAADAVLLGAVGLAQPLPPGATQPEQAILRLRVALGAFANIRTARCLPGLEDLSALRPEVARGVDVLVVREVTGGLFYGLPRELRYEDGLRVAVDTCVYDEVTIRRVLEFAFDAAAGRSGRVASVDKANVLYTSGLWRAVASELATEQSGIQLEHVLVDAAAARLVEAPSSFDVIVTENLFGDILSDVLVGIVGSIGMLPSATVGTGVGLYEPVHGSAPDIAGREIANPSGMIATVAMMLRTALGEAAAADAVDAALAAALRGGARTADIARSAPSLGTREFTEAVLDRLDEVGAA